MAEMNLKQITDKLNSEFIGDVRKLVFWYDANAEFSDDINSLELDNAKVLHLEMDNQFYIKYFLECEDTTTNYLVYAPFAKPSIRDNHLEDTIRYSKEFFADRASLLTLDLGIDERYKPVIQKYIKFFANKARTQKFYDLEMEVYDRSTIEIALMSVLCKSKTASFEEVLRCILSDDNFEENKYLVEFEKYDLIEAFWQQVDMAFGYSQPNPTLEKLTISMFVTYAAKTIHTEIPNAWKEFILYKFGNTIAFLDNFMNSMLYADRFDEISKEIWDILGAKAILSKMETETLIDCSIFAGIDDIVVDWMINRLENEDVNAKLSGKTIPEVCLERRKKHFGKNYRSEYFIIENAYHIISFGRYERVSGIHNLVKDYITKTYKMDRRYRYFNFYRDSLDESSKYERLRDLIENIYTNDYLNQITVNWNTELCDADGETGLDLQREFYANKIKHSKERTVVIISDALRYEVADTLFEQLQADEKCNAIISAMQGVLPSYTPLGMASLLPHQSIEYNDKYDVLVDGKVCTSTEQREIQLQKYKPNSRCIQFDSLKNMKQKELREIFTGQDVVYIYHNQVDARGDSAKTENEVFIACEEAIKEIHDLIRRLSSQANTYKFYITADHGFIYKRDKLEASDKISGASDFNSLGQRYAFSNQEWNIEGVCSTKIGKILGNGDKRIIAYPIASDIFKVAGSGQNFVHGGSSPQEMIVPLVEVKVDRGKKEISTAEIALVSLTNKITNLITTLDFVQTEPISDVVKESQYRVYFISEDNEKISNENIVIADKKDKDSVKRMFRLRFSFKNQQYHKSQRYYLVAYDDKNDLEILRHEMIMDIAFADDFGFFR
ncbi:BREX-1 system phosphatase PglZ type A [Aerococcaceae bacterium zg-ZJ1578]|uniref:BREX-1 system phosphatase PglZ type A n=1 Tax=Aerococcaceae bacterium zg-252 TaxID=2796928 RepID=UPI001A2CD844|nr:BREX-1 system phosphatase PglZ type A [Aerococcaceae bacterium zg-1578]